jgi:hypothetical protein
MTLQIVRFTTHPEQVAAVESAITELFGAVGDARPSGIRYLATRHPDRPQFELLLHLADGADNPLPGIPRAARFRQQMTNWAPTAPAPESAIVLGRYRILD